MPKLRRLTEHHADTDKVTINLGHVDLGRIDLLVREGFYSNRTDFIRSAVRAQLQLEAQAVVNSVNRLEYELGLFDVTVELLERFKERGELLSLRVIGLARVSEDVPIELARETIVSISVLGSLQATKAMKEALEDRMN